MEKEEVMKKLVVHTISMGILAVLGFLFIITIPQLDSGLLAIAIFSLIAMLATNGKYSLIPALTACSSLLLVASFLLANGHIPFIETSFLASPSFVVFLLILVSVVSVITISIARQYAKENHFSFGTMLITLLLEFAGILMVCLATEQIVVSQIQKILKGGE